MSSFADFSNTQGVKVKIVSLKRIPSEPSKLEHKTDQNEAVNLDENAEEFSSDDLDHNSDEEVQSDNPAEKSGGNPLSEESIETTETTITSGATQYVC